MFRDLKEYQEIHNLYQNSVYLSEDERKFIETVNETEFTDEELLYFSENTEEVINHLIESEILNENIFKLGGLVKGIKNIKGINTIIQEIIPKPRIHNICKTNENTNITKNFIIA